MSYNEAINKAAKLLRLSKSSNPHEAALAGARAQEIITRFKLDAMSLEISEGEKPDEPIKNFGDDPIDQKGGTWRWRLVLPVAKHNQCKLYLSGGKPCLIGRPSDVQTVRYIYGWLSQEVESLTAKECLGNGRTYANNFRLGCVDTIQAKFDAMRKETEDAMKREAQEKDLAENLNTGMALIRINSAIVKLEQKAQAVEQWAEKNMRLRRGSASRSRYDRSAREHGRIAGQNIRIQPTKAFIG